nr:hypothetical protein [uncultured Emticicia sp.]
MEFDGWYRDVKSITTLIEIKIEKAIRLKVLFVQIKFKPYTFDPNAKQLEFNKWYSGTGVITDFFMALFQKSLRNRTKFRTIFNGFTTGDFNNDCWVDYSMPVIIIYTQRPISHF